MVTSMTRSLCEKASARSSDRGGATAPTALVISLTAATASALTNINTRSRISLRCDHSTCKNCLPVSTPRFLKAPKSVKFRQPCLGARFVMSSLVARLHDAAVAPEAWPDALTALTDAAGVAGAALIIFNKATGKVDEAHFCIARWNLEKALRMSSGPAVT